MIPTGSPRRILSLTSSKKGSAEQGGGGQQPPVESLGVFIDFWREAVPYIGPPHLVPAKGFDIPSVTPGL